MWVYEKKLQFPVDIKKKDLKMAKLLTTQYGGGQGELGAAIRYLNQRFTSSSSSIVSAVGMFALIVPFEGDGKTHTLKFRNLKTEFGQAGSTLYTLDANKTNPVIVNGNAEFRNIFMNKKQVILKKMWISM